MQGNTSPIRLCDSDCALVNGCQVGGVQCDDCGLWFCASELNYHWNGDWICDECANKRAEQEREDEEDCDV